MIAAFTSQAGICQEPVDISSSPDLVNPFSTIEHVIAAQSDQHVITDSAAQCIVTGSTGQCHRHRRHARIQQVIPVTTTQLHSLDFQDRVISSPDQAQHRQHEIDVSRFDNPVVPCTSAERVVAIITSQTITGAGLTVKQVIPISTLKNVSIATTEETIRSIAPYQQIVASIARQQIITTAGQQCVIARTASQHNVARIRRTVEPIISLTADEFDAMWTDLVALMKVGVRRGKIIVVRPEHDRGAPSYRQGRPRTYVYRRALDPCRVCGTGIRTTVLEGRNLFWCPGCQS